MSTFSQKLLADDHSGDELHRLRLISIVCARLRELEVQEAILGIRTTPEITIEIVSLRDKLRSLQKVDIKKAR